MKSNIKNKHLRNDLMLVAILLVLAVLGSIYLFFLRPEGNSVEVMIDGEVYATYSLSQDRVEDICTGKNGDQINRLVIRDGKAFIEMATCPDGICANHQAIFRDGESIVCLPHRVVIAAVTDKKADSPDVVA